MRYKFLLILLVLSIGCATAPSRRYSSYYKDLDERGYISLNEFARKYDFQIDFDPFLRKIYLTKGDSVELIFALESSVALLNDQVLRFEDSLKVERGDVQLSAQSARMIINQIYYGKKPQVEKQKKIADVYRVHTIVLDPGHGGKDPGAGEVGYSRLPEKTLVLAIAKEIETQLKACGARIIMTRTADYFVPLDDRAEIADKHKADILLSIHIDSCPKGYVSGPTVYIANQACYQSRRVADSIHSSFVSAGIGSKGIRHADFRVLAKHSRPAVLVECGYLTNSTDARKLNNRWYQKKISKLISDGVILALGEK